MALLERVATLIKANLNDLLDKAEDPDKLLKQLLLDMQNQFMQLKTQLAMAIADQHQLEKKAQENLELHKEWVRKAELAVAKNEEELARIALDRAVTYERAAQNFSQQVEDQSHQVRSLRAALHDLEQKITETKAKSELLIARHRRARLTAKTGVEFDRDSTFERLRSKVNGAEASAYGHVEASEPSAEERLAALDKAEQIDKMLRDLKVRMAERAG